MKDHENIVRRAAAALHDAIVEAEAAGYRVLFPRHRSGLKGIAISETKAVAAAVKEEAPATGQKSAVAAPATSADKDKPAA